MANIFNYSVATDTGKGFITQSEAGEFSVQQFPGNVYVCANCAASIAWISKVSGTVKTLSEAQTIVDTQIAALQAAWDAQTPEEKENPSAPRPTAITLPSIPDLESEATASRLTLTYNNARNGWTLK